MCSIDKNLKMTGRVMFVLPKSAANKAQAHDALVVIYVNYATCFKQSSAAVRLLKRNKYKSYKIHFLRELNYDGPDRRKQFYMMMMDMANDNQNFVRIRKNKIPLYAIILWKSQKKN